MNVTQSPETRLCKIIMVLRGVDDHHLARSTGYALGTVRNLLSESGPEYLLLKRAIEHTLDCRIWSRPSEFRRRPVPKVTAQPHKAS